MTRSSCRCPCHYFESVNHCFPCCEPDDRPLVSRDTPDGEFQFGWKNPDGTVEVVGDSRNCDSHIGAEEDA